MIFVYQFYDNFCYNFFIDQNNRETNNRGESTNTIRVCEKVMLKMVVQIFFLRKNGYTIIIFHIVT